MSLKNTIIFMKHIFFQIHYCENLWAGLSMCLVLSPIFRFIQVIGSLSSTAWLEKCCREEEETSEKEEKKNRAKEGTLITLTVSFFTLYLFSATWNEFLSHSVSRSLWHTISSLLFFTLSFSFSISLSFFYICFYFFHR